MPRLTFNAPIILSLFFVAFIVLVLSAVLPLAELLAAGGPIRLDLRYLWGLFTYPFAHADWMHFISNFSILLLVGPVLEEKHGSRLILIGFLLTTLLIGIVHTAFVSGYIIGASGLVFFCIILVSMTNFRRGELPLTLVIVTLLYLGKEVVGLASDDQISQIAHILGGVCGGVMGYAVRLKHA